MSDPGSLFPGAYDHPAVLDQSALGILYEAFDAAVNAQVPMSGWTIDSLFLAPDYPA